MWSDPGRMTEGAARTPIIRIRGLSKCYRIYDKPEDRLKQMIRRRRRYYREFWALQGIDLDVYPGETVGILGRNGSGKTTLLQLITGTLTPTEGRVETRGKIAALLGLGAGFNPDFSGRENAILNATLLGMSRAEIAAVFPRIAEFADIGEFMDRPVKTYSSGMYSRLAFAVAIHVDPDILIVDETLSVGDEAFQRKCFARIDTLKQQGATILFVTHSAPTVVHLCDRAVLLDHGERLLTGSPKAVVTQYQRLLYAPPERLAELREEVRALERGVAVGPRAAVADEALFDPELKPKSTTETEACGAVIATPVIETLSGRLVNHLVPDETYRISYQVRALRPCHGVRFAMMLRSMTGIEVSGQVSHMPGDGVDLAVGAEVEVRFPFVARLTPGTYFVSADVSDASGAVLHRVSDGAMFRIQPDPARLAAGLAACLVADEPASVARCRS